MTEKSVGFGPTILEAVLTEEHHDAGLWLTETEDFLYLYHRGDVVAKFSSRGATVAAVRREADSWIKKQRKEA